MSERYGKYNDKIESMLKEGQEYLLALNRHNSLGSRRLLDLKKSFKSWDKVWEASEKQLRQAVKPEVADAVVDARNRFNPENEIHIAQKVGFNVVEYGESDYPQSLLELSDPPALLYIKGTLESLNQPTVAVVGSRRATQYGYQSTEVIFRPIARCGITIVSGLALGVDTIAHKTAVENGGKTIAVLGCGLDQVYPTSNQHLAQKILDTGGALVSEFAPGLPSYRSNFPIRNRIIAGLSQLTVVIEALADSGALITARAALEYNREVGAVPGDINRPQALGPINLIKMGASVITSADDVLVALGLEPGVEELSQQQSDLSQLSNNEKVVIEKLSREPVHVDKLSKEVMLDIADVNSALVMLELKGVVKNLGGNLYIKM